MKKLFGFLISFLLICNISIAKEIDSSKIKQTVIDSVNNTVSVVSLNNNEYGICSGVLLLNNKDKSVILTAKHCTLTMNSEMYVEGILVSRVGVSNLDDLAYLILNEQIPNKFPVSIAPNLPDRKSFVFAVGYPPEGLQIKFGILDIKPLGVQYAKINIMGGMSGGGLFNEKGELIGITIQHIPFVNIGVFERLQDVKKFIKDNDLL